MTNPTVGLEQAKTQDKSLLQRILINTNRYFAVNSTHFPELKQRTDAMTILYISLAYAYAWFNYTFIYGLLFGSLKLGAICLFIGLPTALTATWILKQKHDIALSSVIANGGGITTVLLIMILTGGAWSHQIVWCIVAVLATFIVQSSRAGLIMTAYVSSASGLVAFFVQPSAESGVFWEFPFAISSVGHGYFNAITFLTAPALAAACAFIFKSRQENALRESESLRSEADLARKQAEELAAQVQEHVRDIRSMLENTKIGLFSITREMAVHKDYARYLEKIVEEDDIAGKSFSEILLKHAELGSDEKSKIITAMEYALGEDEIFFEANASVFPRECVVSFGHDKRKTLDIEWVPVTDQSGSVEKILISLVDVSETLKLRAEAEEGRRSLRYLSELIELAPGRFERFDQSAHATWSDIQVRIKKGRDEGILDAQDLRQIYVGLHTIKGTARLYKLSELTDKIHQAEEILNLKSCLEGEAIVELARRMDEVLHSHKMYSKAHQPIAALLRQAQQNARTTQSDFTLQAIAAEMQPLAASLAKDLGKLECPIQLEIPEEIHFEPSFSKALTDSFVHLVRNSLDHGIEAPAERKAKGLAEHGSIRLFIDSEGRLGFQDDGRGLPFTRLREKAEAAGRKNPSLAETVEMIFLSGVSTKATADDISGRGVGMDAVRSFLQAVGSHIEVVPLREEGDYLKFYFAITLPTAGSRLKKVS